MPFVLALSAVLLGACSPAGADVFGPSVLASSGNVSVVAGEGISEQAQYAHDTAISGNGRYLAFDGAIGTSGSIPSRFKSAAVALVALVAAGASYQPGSP